MFAPIALPATYRLTSGASLPPRLIAWLRFFWVVYLVDGRKVDEVADGDNESITLGVGGARSDPVKWFGLSVSLNDKACRRDGSSPHDSLAGLGATFALGILVINCERLLDALWLCNNCAFQRLKDFYFLRPAAVLQNGYE